MIRWISRGFPFALAAAVMTAAACGSRGGEAAQSASNNPADSGITITEAQRGQFQTEKIARRSFSPTIISTGTVAFNGDKSTQVISSISGPVSRIMVNPGDSVVPGQVLALVASPDFAGAIAGFRKAETMLRNAQRIAALDEKLFANDALARAQLDQAKADLASAEADQDAAVQQLKSLGVDEVAIAALRDGKPAPGAVSAIRAPIAGIVVEKLITPGQLLQAGGTPAFTIADLSSVWVMGNVFGDEMTAIRKGTLVAISTDVSSDTLQGTVDYVGALVDPGSKATAVRILVPNRGRILRQNMLVNVAFRGTRAREGVLVPVSAVLRDDENLPFVYLATDKATRFLRRRIAIAGRTGDFYEVATGLEPGDAVVTKGALYLQEAGAQ
jgi:cobalt-zinc-cadmium efflux system membrane fusion protein